MEKDHFIEQSKTDNDDCFDMGGQDFSMVYDFGELEELDGSKSCNIQPYIEDNIDISPCKSVSHNDNKPNPPIKVESSVCIKAEPGVETSDDLYFSSFGKDMKTFDTYNPQEEGPTSNNVLEEIKPPGTFSVCNNQMTAVVKREPPEEYRKCTHCSFRHKLKIALTNHLRQVHGADDENKPRLVDEDKPKHHEDEITPKKLPEKSFNCRRCRIKIKSKSELVQHLRIVHSKKKAKSAGSRSSSPYEFKCLHCYYSCTWKFNMKRHLLNMHCVEFSEENCSLISKRDSVSDTESQLTCYHCGYKQVNKAGLIMHIKYAHKTQNKDKLPVTQIAHDASDDSDEKCVEDRSEKVNTSGRSFSCSFCSFSHKRERNVEYHVALYHREYSRRFVCLFCGQKSTLKGNVKGHAKRVHGFTEGRAYKVVYLRTKSVSDVRSDFKNADVQNDVKFEQREEREPAEAPFGEETSSMLSCYHCEHKNKSRSGLIMHLRRVHGHNSSRWCTENDGIVLDAKADASAVSDGIFTCRFCGSVYEQERNLESHIASNHRNYSRLFMCLFCDHKAKYKSSIKVHARNMHSPTDRKSYKIIYFPIDETNKHAHTEPDDESKVVAKKTDLELKSSETAQNPTTQIEYKYKCSTCKFQTDVKREMKHHEKHFHPKCIRWYECLICGFKTTFKIYFQNHLRYEHYPENQEHKTDHSKQESKRKTVESSEGEKEKPRFENFNVTQPTYHREFIRYKVDYLEQQNEHKNKKDSGLEDSDRSIFPYEFTRTPGIKYPDRQESEKTYKKKEVYSKKPCPTKSVISSSFTAVNTKPLNRQENSKKCEKKKETYLENLNVNRSVFPGGFASSTDQNTKCYRQETYSKDEQLCWENPDVIQSIFSSELAGINAASIKCSNRQENEQKREKEELFLANRHPNRTLVSKEFTTPNASLGQQSSKRKRDDEEISDANQPNVSDKFAKAPEAKSSQQRESEQRNASGELLQCSSCDFRTRWRASLSTHVKCFHQEYVWWFVCMYCDYQSKHSNMIRKHLRDKHQTNEDMYQSVQLLNDKFTSGS